MIHIKNPTQRAVSAPLLTGSKFDFFRPEELKSYQAYQLDSRYKEVLKLTKLVEVDQPEEQQVIDSKEPESEKQEKEEVIPPAVTDQVKEEVIPPVVDEPKVEEVVPPQETQVTEQPAPEVKQEETPVVESKPEDTPPAEVVEEEVKETDPAAASDAPASEDEQKEPAEKSGEPVRRRRRS